MFWLNWIHFSREAGRCWSRPLGGSSGRFSRTQVNFTQLAAAVSSSVFYKNRFTTWNVNTRTCRSRGSCTQMTCREEVLHHHMHDGEEELQHYRRRVVEMISLDRQNLVMDTHMYMNTSPLCLCVRTCTPQTLVKVHTWMRFRWINHMKHKCV